MEDHLIPSLPDDISTLCLARTACFDQQKACSVCRKWEFFLNSKPFYNIRRINNFLEEHSILMLRNLSNDDIELHGYDPLRSVFYKVPSLFITPPKLRNETVMSSQQSRKYKHYDLYKKKLVDEGRFSGMSAISFSGNLYVIGGFKGNVPTNNVVIYNPRIKKWLQGSKLTQKRAFCKLCILDDSLYVIGGHGKNMEPLHSAEVLNSQGNKWNLLSNLTFPGKLNMPGFDTCIYGTAVLSNKIIAVQCQYKWPYIIFIGGEAYSSKTGTWAEVSEEELGQGWPISGFKLTAVKDNRLFALQSSDLSLSVYNNENHAWENAVKAEKQREEEFYEIFLDSGERNSLFRAHMNGDDVVTISNLVSGEQNEWRSVVRKRFQGCELLGFYILSC